MVDAAAQVQALGQALQNVALNASLFRMYILKISKELFLLCQMSRFEEENKS